MVFVLFLVLFLLFLLPFFRSGDPRGSSGLPYPVCVRIAFYFRLAPGVSLAADRKFTTKSYRTIRVSLYFVVICFLRDASSLLLVGLVHTGLQCVPYFLFAWLSFSDSTRKTSACSFYVDMEFFVRYEIMFMPTFPPLSHFLRFDLMFRTHRQTRSPAVASAPPRTFSRFVPLCLSVCAFPCSSLRHV